MNTCSVAVRVDPKGAKMNPDHLRSHQENMIEWKRVLRAIVVSIAETDPQKASLLSTHIFMLENRMSASDLLALVEERFGVNCCPILLDKMLGGALDDAATVLNGVIGCIQFIHTARDNSAAMQKVADTPIMPAEMLLDGLWIKGEHKGDRTVVKTKGRTPYGKFKDVTFGSKYRVVTTGEGTFTSDRVKYKGGFRENNFHDTGIAVCEVFERYKYHGSFIKGLRHGPGKLMKYDPRTGKYFLEFEGTFMDNEPYNGSYFTETGDIAVKICEGKFISPGAADEVPVQVATLVESEESTTITQSPPKPPRQADSSPALPHAPVSNSRAAEQRSPSSLSSLSSTSSLSSSFGTLSMSSTTKLSPRAACDSQQVPPATVDDSVIRELLENPNKPLKSKEAVDILTACIRAGQTNALQVKDKDLIVVIGNTGAGKSTFINYLGGCTMIKKRRKEVGLKGSGSVVVVQPVTEGGTFDEIMAIGHSKVSKTCLPQVGIVLNGSYICDLPGFLDNRGFIINVANACNVRMCLTEATSIKVVILINFYSLKADRARGMQDLLVILSQLFGDKPEDYVDSILLGLSQVPDDEDLEDIKDELTEDSDPIMEKLTERMFIFDPLNEANGGATAGREDILTAIESLPPIRNGSDVFRTVLIDSDMQQLLKTFGHFKPIIIAYLTESNFVEAARILSVLEQLQVIDHKSIDRMIGEATQLIADHFIKLTTAFDTHCHFEKFPEAEALIEEFKRAVACFGQDLEKLIEVSRRSHMLNQTRARTDARIAKEREAELQIKAANDKVKELLRLLAEQKEEMSAKIKAQEEANQAFKLQQAQQMEATERRFAELGKALEEERRARSEQQAREMKEAGKTEKEVERAKEVLKAEYDRKLREAQKEKELLIAQQEKEKAARDAEMKQRQAAAEAKLKEIEALEAEKLKEQAQAKAAEQVPTHTFTSSVVVKQEDRTQAQTLAKNGTIDKINGGYSPLMKAAEDNNTSLIVALLEAGARVDLQNEYGRSPLYWAARYGKVEAMKVLLEAGANVDLQDQLGGSPLYWAAQFGHVEAMKVLLEAGANVDLQDMYGASPLYVAAQFGKVEAMKVLLEAGAYVNLQTKDGKTAFDIANRNNQPKAILLLRAHLRKGR